MDQKFDPMASPYVNVDHYQGDEGYIKEPRSQVLQQQWVTLTASMWPEPTASPRGWRVPSDRLPLLAAIFCGAALVICLLFAFIIYKCCIMPKRDKHYSLRKTEGGLPTTQVPPGAPPAYPSQSVVYAEPKGNSWGYNNQLVTSSSGQGSHWVYSSRVIGGPQQCIQCPGICPVPRSSSHPGSNTQQIAQSIANTSRKQRPVSQPIRFGPCDISNGEPAHSNPVPMPEISEFSPQSAQYASSSVLDDISKDDGTNALKTRSLPAWVRSKPRPLSTEDDLNDLYAKVNFSKKRKNRMRNDEAAIIALSKSRSQFLHKDTDSLVDNEAVIVYDERTAL